MYGLPPGTNGGDCLSSIAARLSAAGVLRSCAARFRRTHLDACAVRCRDRKVVHKHEAIWAQGSRLLCTAAPARTTIATSRSPRCNAAFFRSLRSESVGRPLQRVRPRVSDVRAALALAAKCSQFHRTDALGRLHRKLLPRLANPFFHKRMGVCLPRFGNVFLCLFAALASRAGIMRLARAARARLAKSSRADADSDPELNAEIARLRSELAAAREQLSAHPAEL